MNVINLAFCGLTPLCDIANGCSQTQQRPLSTPNCCWQILNRLESLNHSPARQCSPIGCKVSLQIKAL